MLPSDDGFYQGVCFPSWRDGHMVIYQLWKFFVQRGVNRSQGIHKRIVLSITCGSSIVAVAMYLESQLDGRLQPLGLSHVVTLDSDMVVQRRVLQHI